MQLTESQIKAGRRWAYGTMLLMLALSIAGNLSHTFLINSGAGLRAQTYAVMWPLLVWLGVELFVRIPWQPKASHRTVRWSGVLGPSLIAGIVSYSHLSGLLKADREDWIVYTIGPLAVDGLMLMSTLGLLLTRSLTAAEPAPAADMVDRKRWVHAVAGLEAKDREIAELRAQVEQATQALTELQPEPVPASQEVQQHEETVKLADLMPTPVSPAPAMIGLSLPAPRPVEGWAPPAPATPAEPTERKTRPGRKSWDRDKAREMILMGATKAHIAEIIDVDPKTIQRLRAQMIKAGELPA